MTLRTDIAKAVKQQFSISQIDALIQQHIVDTGEKGTVASWKAACYADLRRWAYPDAVEYNDAQVKLASTDPDTRAAGQTQLDQYLTDCLAVKARFPKPT